MHFCHLHDEQPHDDNLHRQLAVATAMPLPYLRTSISLSLEMSVVSVLWKSIPPFLPRDLASDEVREFKKKMSAVFSSSSIIPRLFTFFALILALRLSDSIEAFLEHRGLELRAVGDVDRLDG